MKKPYIILQTILLFALSSSAQTSLTLIKGEKKKVFTKESDLTFFTSEINNKGDSIVSEYTGNIVSLTSDTINLRPIGISQTIFFKDKRVLNTTKKYRMDSITTINFCINNIDKIRRERFRINNIFSSIAGIASLSALIASPLIAYDYKDNKLDMHNYGRYTGISLITTIVAIIMAQSFDHWDYMIKGYNDVWTISR